MANEYLEAAKKILPKLVLHGDITIEESNEMLDYIKYLEQQEQENDNKLFGNKN